MPEPSLIIAGVVVVIVVLLTMGMIATFLRSVDAGEILLASRGRNLRIYRGPCKALIVPVITQIRIIPAQAINVDIEITDQTADVDPSGRSAPVKVTVRASAIVSVGEDESMVSTAANKFFSKSGGEQLSTLTDVLSSAGRLRPAPRSRSRARATWPWSRRVARTTSLRSSSRTLARAS
jgi:flotillin